jgi:hypothetical protein
MAAATTEATTTCSSSSSSSTTNSPIHSSAVPHHRRRQLTDVERDAADSCCAGCADADDEGGELLHGHGAATPCGGSGRQQQALLLARRKRAWAAAPAPAWMRAVVLCFLGLVAVVGFLGSYRGGGGAGTTVSGTGDDGGRLLRRVEVADADTMEWTEENVKALARRPPDAPVRACTSLIPVVVDHSPPCRFVTEIIFLDKKAIALSPIIKRDKRVKQPGLQHHSEVCTSPQTHSLAHITHWQLAKAKT